MAKLKLGPVNHGTDKNRYCGPSVISAVTSLTTGEAARLIRMQSGKRSVKGTSTMEVKRALKACNIEMHHVPSPGQTRFGRRDGITLAHWLRLTPLRVRQNSKPGYRVRKARTGEETGKGGGGLRIDLGPRYTALYRR